jgi:N-hydroxyarylamine O-acetyltransferase
VEIDAYFRRIEYDGPREPTPEVFERLHLAHVGHIPFENLDILLGRPILLDLESLSKKLVANQRGGYCFEQNTLYAAVLEELGFQVQRLAARVRMGATSVLPRTHMLLCVEIGVESWLADVGFGASGLLRPIRLVSGAVSRQFAWTYRLVEESGLWILQGLQNDAWQDMYAFTQEPQFPVDYEMANHYTSTHPTSRFVQTLTAQLSTPEARYTLRGREIIVEKGTEVRQQTIEDDEALLEVLALPFGLRFPAGTRFRQGTP